MVAAVAAGDPRGIADAYDRYAVPLYSYCRSLLPEPADAADAVQDTFLIATTKLSGLRHPDKLRAWLYAVARNECYRRLRSGKLTSALEDAAGLTADPVDVSSAIEQAELRQLVRDALGGLNPGERDVVELSLVHGLDGDELAAALRISRNHAHALQSRARSQLERSLGALLVARTGRDACAVLDGLLAGWDGQLTVLMRKRISRHVEHCEACGERKRRELSPALFAGAPPLIALAPWFREHLLRICADTTPAAAAHRAAAAARAGQFGQAGFPAPARPPGVSGWHQLSRHSHAVAASAATAAAAAGVSAVLVIGGGGPQAPGAGARGSAGPGVIANGRGAPSRGGPAGPASSAGPAGAAGNPAPGLATSPAARAAGGAPGAATSAPGSPPSARSSPAAASSAPSSSAPSVVPGTVTVSVSRLVLVAVNGHGVGTFAVTAQGGPVSFTIAAPGGLAISPASGSLASGASATITVTSPSLVTLDEQLTVNPGGYTVTVVLNLSL